MICWCYDVKIQDSDAEDDDHDDDDDDYYYYDDGDDDDDDDGGGDDDDGDDDDDDDDGDGDGDDDDEEEDEDDSIQNLYGRYAAGWMMTIDDVFATGDHCISLRWSCSENPSSNWGYTRLKSQTHV